MRPKRYFKATVKRTAYPDVMNIRLTTDGIISGHSIKISIKKFRDTASCPWTEPDVVAYQITNTPTDTIYSIEHFFNKKMPAKKGALSVYGYPS